MSGVTLPQVLFLVFAALMLGSALGVIFARNQVYAAMSLVASFFFLAGIYALLYAHTLAVLQILVYAGAIVVLFLFVIMLLSLEETPRQGLEITPMRVLALLAIAGIALTTLRAVARDEVATSIIRVLPQTESGEYQVQFASSPFRSSQYATGPLGEGSTAATRFSVISVTDGPTPEQLVRILSTTDSAHPLQPGQPVTLRWAVEELAPRFGTVAEVGALLYQRYLLPFEVTSLLLLVAIVGAVVVAKGRI